MEKDSIEEITNVSNTLLNQLNIAVNFDEKDIVDIHSEIEKISNLTTILLNQNNIPSLDKLTELEKIHNAIHKTLVKRSKKAKLKGIKKVVTAMKVVQENVSELKTAAQHAARPATGRGGSATGTYKVEDGKPIPASTEGFIFHGSHSGIGWAENGISVDLNSRMVNNLFDEVKKRATVNGRVDGDKIIMQIFNVVFLAMPYNDGELLEKILWKSAGLDHESIMSSRDRDRIIEAQRYYINNRSHDPIPLDSFIEDGYGVCRHKAALAAALLLKSKKEGLISGNIYINYGKNDRDGHAWAEYERPDSVFIIIDVAQRYIGNFTPSQNKFTGMALVPIKSHSDAPEFGWVARQPEWSYRPGSEFHEP